MITISPPGKFDGVYVASLFGLDIVVSTRLKALRCPSSKCNSKCKSIVPARVLSNLGEISVTGKYWGRSELTVLARFWIRFCVRFWREPLFGKSWESARTDCNGSGSGSRSDFESTMLTLLKKETYSDCHYDVHVAKIVHHAELCHLGAYSTEVHKLCHQIFWPWLAVSAAHDDGKRGKNKNLIYIVW